MEDFNAEVQRYLTSQGTLGNTVSPEDAANTVRDDLTAQLLLAQGAHTDGFTLDDSGLQARIELAGYNDWGSGVPFPPGRLRMGIPIRHFGPN